MFLNEISIFLPFLLDSHYYLLSCKNSLNVLHTCFSSDKYVIKIYLPVYSLDLPFCNSIFVSMKFLTLIKFNLYSYIYMYKVICMSLYIFASDQISCSLMSDSLRPHESQHARPPCPSPTPGVHPDSRPSSK